MVCGFYSGFSQQLQKFNNPASNATSLTSFLTDFLTVPISYCFQIIVSTALIRMHYRQKEQNSFTLATNVGVQRLSVGVGVRRLVFITAFVRFGPMSDIVCKQHRSAPMLAAVRVTSGRGIIINVF